MISPSHRKYSWLGLAFRAIGLAFLLLLWLGVLAIFWFVLQKPRLTLPVSDQILAGLSPDGKIVATLVEGIPGSSGGPLVLWDAENANKLGVIGDRKNQFRTSVHFSPDGKLMAAREVKEYPNEELVIFDLATLAKLASIEIQTPLTSRPTACFSPDSRLLAFNAKGGDKDCVKVWDLNTRQEPITMQGGNRPSFFFPDGKTLVTNDQQGRVVKVRVVKLFDSQTGEPRLSWLKDVGAEEVSPGGKWAAAVNRPRRLRYSNVVTIWDLATQKEIAALEHESQPRFISDSILATEYSAPDSREVRLMLWYLQDAKQTDDLRFTRGPLVHRGAFFFSIPGTNYLAVRTSLPFSILGKTAEGPEALKILDASTCQELGTLVDWVEPTYEFELSRDAKTVATQSQKRLDLTVQVWDIPPRKRLIWIIMLLALPGVIAGFIVWRRRRRGRQHRPEAARGGGNAV